MRLNLAAACLALIPLHASRADVRLANVFSDHMVVQQEMPIRVWGEASAGERVAVQFNGQEASTAADAGGSWRVELPAMKADGKPLTLVVRGTNTIELQDVLLGEVWLASGQSNMAWPMRQALQPAGLTTNLPNVRVMQLEGGSVIPEQTLRTKGWQRMTPESSTEFSAIGFYFARRLNAELKVPVGVIGAYVGGTNIESWIPATGFKAVPELKQLSDGIEHFDVTTPKGLAQWEHSLNHIEDWLKNARADVAANRTPRHRAPPSPALPQVDFASGTPTTNYNGLIHPIRDLSIRGAIWDQGESNANDSQYRFKMKALVDGWRGAFKQEKLPFYYVQIQSRNMADPTIVREQQYLASEMLEGVGMAVTYDACIGLHPENKLTPGERLAGWALAKTYGIDVPHLSPVRKSHRVDGDKIVIEFANAAGGLVAGSKSQMEPVQLAPGDKIELFAIAGDDKRWHKASVRIEGSSVIVSSPEVKQPVAVRYAFANNVDGVALYNRDLLPASPFRTDDWQVP